MPWVWAGAAGLAVALWAATTLVNAPAAATAPGVLRFTVDSPPGTRLASGGSVSPDRRHLAFIAQDDASGVAHLWVRTLDEGTSRVIEGTEGAGKPFWSPDGQAIGFFAAGTLKRVGVGGGPVQTLAPVVGLTVSGGTWGTDDVILFASFRSGVNAVTASGHGKVTPATHLDAAAQETAHRWPQFLPDGRFLFLNLLRERGSGRHLRRHHRLDGTGPRAARYGRDGRAHRPPPVRERPGADGAAVQCGPDPRHRRGDHTAGDMLPASPTTGASTSAAGEILTYGGRAPDSQLVWFSRSGERKQTIKAPPNLYNPSISQDLRYLLAGSGTDVLAIRSSVTQRRASAPATRR